MFPKEFTVHPDKRGCILHISQPGDWRNKKCL